MISNGQQLRQEAKLRQRIEEALQEIEIEAINTTNNRVIDNQVNCAGFESQANCGYSENSLNGLRSSSPKLVNSFDWLFPSSLWSPVNGWALDHVCAYHHLKAVVKTHKGFLLVLYVHPYVFDFQKYFILEIKHVQIKRKFERVRKIFRAHSCVERHLGTGSISCLAHFSGTSSICST